MEKEEKYWAEIENHIGEQIFLTGCDNKVLNKQDVTAGISQG